MEILGERGDPDVRPRCEYTDPRARFEAEAPDVLRLATMPQEVIHVRRPITPGEDALLPRWFREAPPVDEAGAGVPIVYP